MGIINCLSRDVYDKIAAGEVVERPASVIKELVENSIDAGADKIVVEIKNGGNVYMRVTDNGSGMANDDAKLAFIRHATSKISEAEDLEAISTMGFRGEALASIAAVAQVDLFTKRPQDEAGTHVVCIGGEIREVSEVGTADGTVFIVKNLFYNVPARMKFLKKDATEAAYISNIMIRFILSHPEISFRFINNDKEQLFSPGDNNIINSIYSVYGKNFAKSAIEFNTDYEGIRVYGAAGKGDTARPNKDYQSCFVNKRYVKSPLVFRAIEEAYKNQVMVGKFPMAVINIEINPAMIDINVHPTKLEVKFSDESLVYRAVYHSVKTALYSIMNIPEIKTEEKEEKFIPPTKPEPKPEPEYRKPSEKKSEFVIPGHSLLVKEERVSYEKPLRPEEKAKRNSYYTDVSDEYFKKKQEEIASKRSSKTFGQEMMELISGEKPDTTAPETETKPEPKPEPEKQEQFVYKADEEKRQIRVVGQVFNTYIIIESEGEMLIIDQHAAHERLMYEKLKKDISEKKVVSQTMLVPVVVNLNPVEYAAFKEYAGQIEEMGFETEEFGDNSILIRSTPYDIDSGELEELIINIINNFSQNKNEVITEKQDRLLYTIACKAAVKANHSLTAEEQKNLAERVLDFDNINTCPHGRPITIAMTKKELEKQFKRIV